MNFADFKAMEWLDFSGGFTDDVYTDDTSRCAYNSNLLIDTNRKTELRPGSNLYYPASPQHPNGSNRVGRFMKFPDETSLFARSGPSLAYDSGSAWTALTGLGSHAAFPGLATSANVSWAYWNSQYFMTNDSAATAIPPVRVYKDSGGTWRLITAGLPAPTPTYTPAQATLLANLITLANAIRTKVLAHFADVTDHAGIGTTTHRTADVTSGTSIGAAATDQTTLFSLTGQLLKAYQLHFNDARTANTYHARDIPDADWLVGGSIGTVGSPPFLAPVATVAQSTLLSTDAPTTLMEAVTRLNDLRLKYNTHDGVTDSHQVQPGNNQVTAVPISASAYGPLIEIDTAKLYSIANNMKARINAHMAAGASANFAHTTADTVNTIVTANATTPTTLAILVYATRAYYTGHDDDASRAAGWAYHRADEGTGFYTSRRFDLAPGAYTGGVGYPDWNYGVLSGDWAQMVELMNDTKVAYNNHAGHLVAHHPASVTTQNPYIVAGEDLALADYLYAFHYKYSFTVGTLTYEIVGPVLEVPAFGVLATTVQALAISNIPSLANTSVTNYDTSNITVQIYRTTDAGNTFYKVGQVTNGTTTFTDIVTDTELIGNELLYITGGVVDHDPPPIANCVHIVNNTGYYGGVTDTGEYFPNRVRQSVPGSPDACPGDFFDDLPDSVIGISSVRTIPVVGCSHSFYRLDGAFTERGAGAITHQQISSTVGLVSEASIVQVEGGLFFAGTDGFYFTDGYQVNKVSDAWDPTYAAYTASATQRKRIVGAYDSHFKRVWWTIQPTSSDTTAVITVTLDLNFPLSKPCWTSARNGTHYLPSAVLFYNDQLIRGHESGYIFKHSDSLLTDPYIDSGISAANWGTAVILFDWKSTFVSWGTTNIRKWCPLIEFNLQDDSNLFLQINGFNDNTRSNHALTPLRWISEIVWGDETIVWGDPAVIWNWSGGNIDSKRYVPAGSLRCTYKQVEFTNASVDLLASTTKGPASTNAAANTVTLDTAAMYWPLDAEGGFISFANDDYAASWEIFRKNSTTLPTVLTVIDTGNTLPTLAGVAWKISGYKKNQTLHLLDLSLWGKPMSASQTGTRV